MQISFNSYTALEKEEANSVSKIKGAVKDSFAKIDEEGKKKEEEEQKKAQEELRQKLSTADPTKTGIWV